MTNLLAVISLVLTFGLGFWIGYDRALARGVRYGYAAGLKYARNTLRRK